MGVVGTSTSLLFLTLLVWKSCRSSHWELEAPQDIALDRVTACSIVFMNENSSACDETHEDAKDRKEN